jgi:hypothetical protein
MIAPPRRSRRARLLALLLVGCAGHTTPEGAGARAPETAAMKPPGGTRAVSPAAGRSSERTITVLLGNDPETAYCDGERMDSAGYRRTLTKEKELRLPPEGASASDVVRAVIDAATVGMCNTVMRQLEYRIEAGSVHIPPFDSWAGVSMTMCTCQPEIEVNLVRIPGVARVVWDEQ